MMVRTLVLFFIIAPGSLCAMEEMATKPKKITHRLIKICYQQPPEKEKSHYVSAIEVNCTRINNNGEFHFVQVFNDKLYIQQSDTSSHQSSVVQTALKDLFEIKKITINPAQEIIRIKPIRRHNNQRGGIVPGKCDDIDIENNTQKIPLITIKVMNKIHSPQGHNFFNGTYIQPDKSTITIRAPEGHIIIETIGTRPIALKNLPSSGYLKLWLNYYRQEINAQNNYLDRLHSRLIQAPYLNSQYKINYIPAALKRVPAPLLGQCSTSKDIDRFEQTLFNYLPNELLAKIATYVVHNSYKATVQKHESDSSRLELKHNDLDIPSFESLSEENDSVSVEKPQTPLQMH